jgi:transposase
LTPVDQKRRELVRWEAIARFERGETNPRVARALRVRVRQVAKWRAAWRAGGAVALGSKGPPSRPRLDEEDFARLETEPRRGSGAHGWEEDQRWTLARVRTLIQRLFKVSSTVTGVGKLPRRHGWSSQVPVRGASGSDCGGASVGTRIGAGLGRGPGLPPAGVPVPVGVSAARVPRS